MFSSLDHPPLLLQPSQPVYTTYGLFVQVMHCRLSSMFLSHRVKRCVWIFSQYISCFMRSSTAQCCSECSSQKQRGLCKDRTSSTPRPHLQIKVHGRKSRTIHVTHGCEEAHASHPSYADTFPLSYFHYLTVADGQHGHHFPYNIPTPATPSFSLTLAQFHSIAPKMVKTIRNSRYIVLYAPPHYHHLFKTFSYSTISTAQAQRHHSPSHLIPVLLNGKDPYLYS
ncbi:hypothetical protein EDB19DRAFT_1047150 [Suillus lakei]|nr:hypothetical protein EDB19DRAFT_1047150 [Suillus lakei]